MLDSKTDKLIILDGQHRFCAWRKLHLPIYFYETISGDDTTQGLRQRNLGKAWTTIDIVNSFALDKRKPEQAAQYYELSRIIKYTQELLGRVPLTVLIELASGINRGDLLDSGDYDLVSGLYLGVGDHPNYHDRDIDQYMKKTYNAIPADTIRRYNKLVYLIENANINLKKKNSIKKGN